MKASTRCPQTGSEYIRLRRGAYHRIAWTSLQTRPQPDIRSLFQGPLSPRASVFIALILDHLAEKSLGARNFEDGQFRGIRPQELNQAPTDQMLSAVGVGACCHKVLWVYI